MRDAFLSALSFLTVIKIRNVNFDAKSSLRYFPLVGCFIGFIVVINTLLFIEHAPIINLIFTVVITGGLHLDGLADTTDAYFSNKDREKMLEIMKDSRVGTMGVLALFLVLITKFYSFAHTTNPFYLVAPFVYSRASMLHLIKNLNYLRKDGTGKAFFISIEKDDFVLSYIFYFSTIIFGVKYFIIVNMIYFFSLKMIERYHLKKVGGATGDILGATSELIETLLLMVGTFIG